MQDAAELAVLEGAYLWQLFTVQQELEGRFFRYVAAVLAQRLRNREQVRKQFQLYSSLFFFLMLFVLLFLHTNGVCL